MALITGAGGGIGRASTQLFARERARVVVADLDEPAGQAATDEVCASGGSALSIRADVRCGSDVRAMIAFAESRSGGLHILFNNAAILPDSDG